MQHTLQQRLPLHTRAVTPKMWQRIVSGNSPTPRAVHRPRHIADSACRCAPGPSSSSSGDIDGVNKANGRQLASSPTYAVSQQAVEAPSFPTSLPLLPFPAEEVLTPGAVKTLHLYEARYITLLEEVLASDHRMFVHAVIEQQDSADDVQESAQFPGAYVGSNFVLQAATLVRVVQCEAAPVGAVVRIQAEGRLVVAALKQLQPFIRATVLPLCDDAVVDEEGLQTAVEQLRLVMRDASNLAAKFKGRETAGLSSAMYWSACTAPPAMHGMQEADKHLEEAFRLSFAALQVLPMTNPQEQVAVAQQRLKAMTTTDTQQRVQQAAEMMLDAKGMLAAKIALMQLNLT